MDTYYQYRDVKVMIAKKLMAMDGWKVYGYHPDKSDSMTDYFSPAFWDGIAEKNGYILCVNVYGASEPREIKTRVSSSEISVDLETQKKIEKLSRMTVERGASEQEENTARAAILKLQEKQRVEEEKCYITETIPGHLENPPRCNWHIEKDGLIIAKGNGLLKYADISNYYKYSAYINDLKDFRTLSQEKYKEKYIKREMERFNESQERAKKIAESQIEKMKKDIKLIDSFEKLISKFDTTCGGLLGEGDGTIYGKIKVTEYKKELKVVKDENGDLKEGQLFIVKTNFNYGHNKGYVYRIHESKGEDKTLYYAYKLNGKKTKECTGRANSSNYWYITKKFLTWFEKGDLAWCHLEEVEVPYEVEKVVKKTIKKEKDETKPIKKEENDRQDREIKELHFIFLEDTDTRNGEKIFLVKVKEKLTREEYIKVNHYIKEMGGYYSKFKHAFLFKDNPSGKLELEKISVKKDSVEENNSTLESTKKDDTGIKKIKYNVSNEETKNNKIIWKVCINDGLNKTDFANIKQKLAIVGGFYSSAKQAFIFKYDPTEKLENIC